MTNTIATPDLWEMLYLPILNLPQMVPLDTQRVTPGAKRFGT